MEKTYLIVGVGPSLGKSLLEFITKTKSMGIYI